MFTELAVFFNLPGLLRQVRPLPSNYLHFPGKFKMCRNNPCKRDYSCTFAHDELELQAWNKRKKDILDSMHMYVCTYVCMYVCIYVYACFARGWHSPICCVLQSASLIKILTKLFVASTLQLQIIILAKILL